ncbi:MAG: hydroxymethylbilane synthase [Acidimicrobiales bacterium]
MLRIATRGSALARWQAGEVARLLRGRHPGVGVELLEVETTGDRRQDIPVWEMGGQGIFVKEIQAAVLEGRADLAVHSAKDLPSTTPAGIRLAAVPARGDPRDALVGSALDDLAPGAVVATGSVRRRAQLAWLRPDLTFTGLRGNIGTRLERVPVGGAVVVAAAALDRLGLLGRAAEILGIDRMLPQVGQGALAVECRASDERVNGLFAAIDHPTARLELTAERGFLARLGGGCDLPVGAHANLSADGTLTVEAMMASGDGRVLLRDSRRGVTPDPGSAEDLGASLAEWLLDGAGGAELMGLSSGGSGDGGNG